MWGKKLVNIQRYAAVCSLIFLKVIGHRKNVDLTQNPSLSYLTCISDSQPLH